MNNRPPRGKKIGLILGGVVVAALALIVASRLDDSGSLGKRKDPARRIENPHDLVHPAPLTDAEQLPSRAVGAQPLAELESGAWVQVTDDRGNLVQQYGASRVEPLPDRRMRLENPQAYFFRDDGRVITLAAKKGEARVPNRALDSGRLEEDVRIRVFRPVLGVPVDLTKDLPTLLVDADDATFDSVLGRIRCDGKISVKSEAGTFHGRGLSLTVSPQAKSTPQGKGRDDGATIESLIVDQCTEPIVLVRGAEGMRGADRLVPPAGAPPLSAPSAGSPAANSTANPSASPVAPRFYRLVLEDRVRVKREQGGRTSTLTGDRLVAIFSLDSSAAMATVAVAPSVPLAIVASAFASPLQGPSAADAETITIEYDGRLVLEPAKPAEALTTADDVRVELLASSTGVVTLDDDETKAHVECARVSFQAGADLVEAFGTAERALTVSSPRLKATGDHFFLKRGIGQGGFIGQGTIELASGGNEFAALGFDPAHAIVSRDAAGAIVVAALATAPPVGAAPRSVHVAWTEKLDLTFVPTAPGAPGNGALLGAAFIGGVAVRSEAFALDAATLTTEFGRPGEGQSTGAASGRIERIVAESKEGSLATARRTDRGGELSAKKLDLTLTADRNGNAAPALLVASGLVSAGDAAQTIFGERLVTKFVDPASKPAGEPTRPSGSGTSDGPVVADIAIVELTGDVQAELRSPSGPSTRIFADRLDGDGAARTIDVKGDDVWIVRDVVVADGLTGIHFDDITRVATAPGAGRVRAFPEGIAIVDGLAPRPRLADIARLEARWTDGFTFDEKAADGRGAIDLRGGVRVRNKPDRRSTDALDAAQLRLELAGRDERVATDSSAVGGTGLEGERAGIRRIDARGGAVIASRSWKTFDRTDPPRIFEIKGEHIEYDTLTREAHVHSAGSLLAEVPERTSDAPKQSVPASDSLPLGSTTASTTTLSGSPLSLGAEGTSKFLWLGSLDMTRVDPASSDSRFVIRLVEGVQLLHVGRRENDTLTLQSARLEATVTRDVRVDANNAPESTRGVDLGGTARIERIEARGDDVARVLIRTPEYELKCDELIYSVSDQIAELSARPGSTVVVVGRDGQPLKAERVHWNLGTGQITIEGSSGGIAR